MKLLGVWVVKIAEFVVRFCWDCRGPISSQLVCVVLIGRGSPALCFVQIACHTVGITTLSRKSYTLAENLGKINDLT